MAKEPVESAPAASVWQPRQVYLMAGVCLLLGLLAGYLFRGSFRFSSAVLHDASPAAPGSPDGMRQMPTLEQMKHMAEKKAEPLLEKLKSDPNNTQLLVTIADIYKQTHQFKDAADYYHRSLKVDPKNAGVRSDLASCLYYSGDVDGALAQLQEALREDPKNAPALFNLGMIKWQKKKDAKAAVAAWEDLLKSNPQLGADRKAAVQKLIAEAKHEGSAN
ncbi:MAG TPA: tetratricopeptide repeat protein [Terriglobales bacterium]|nr:tetratricopeptide repeat protein [Terriglobales bacterium]